ncbi:IS605 OrfB family transposase [Kibdelosporangium banguiense]|uniref:IS605 OrfB family transposase n=1 Tax=Kibdelosporangium banguiense TaxID=1365924 RepID=A0ABS4T923_9PSEU|nr:zinc ribbon domain-containing protein [Kibdelosporangium banguiense]MBP2320929.1 IS605 OrfB family transposase [Kibdelosporangium banguiense]
MKVTRIAYSSYLNAGKFGRLVEQAARLGRVRSLVWDLCGSIAGVGRSDRQIRDAWMADGTAKGFGVPANAWKETVRDAVADIRAHREAAKVHVRRAIHRRDLPEAERKRLYTLLKRDRWTSDPLLRRWMRRHWRRGRNHTANQIIIRSDKVRTFTLAEGGKMWLAVPGLTPHKSVAVPLDTTQPPSGTLRVILRGGQAEVHYQVDDKALKSAHRPAGQAAVGVDKGYSEVLTDSDGEHHGPELGVLLRERSDLLRARNARRAKLRSIANNAAERGQHRKAERIRRNNLGTVKKHRQQRRWEQRVRTVTYRAVNAVVDKAAVIVAEDLTRSFVPRAGGANTNRRLAAWTKGLTAEALTNVSDRRGSAVRLVNAAYTSQVIPGTNSFGIRSGDRLHCTGCGVVWQADHAAAINILDRAADPDIGLRTPHWRVKQIIQERDRQRSRLPDQDSNIAGHRGCGERTIQSLQALIKE